MKKWPIFLAGTAIAIVGCGGGGGKGTPNTSLTATGATSGDSIATPNLPTTVGLLNIYYITGQGRAQGDLTANFASAVLKGPGEPDPLGLKDPLPKVLNAQLNQYSINAQSIDQVNIVNSAQYNDFDLYVESLQVQDANGNLGPKIFGPGGTFFINPTNGAEQYVPGTGGSFPATVAIFPGRQTTLQVFLNDASITTDPVNFFYEFQRNIFLANNTVPGNPNLQGFMSDYVMFDISKLPANALPNVHLSDGISTVPASRVYLSGEDQHYGASTSVYGGPFCVFPPNNVALTGTFKGPDSLPPPPTGLPPITQGGTYQIRDPDPRDITGGSQVTSLLGIWRPVTSVFSNLGTFEVITMPHIVDDNNQDIVVLVRDANGNITNMYFGLVDLSGLTFTVYPIANIETGAPTGAITGKVSGLIDGTAAATSVPANVRFGRYAFDPNQTLPTGFKTTGRFLVFRV